jgi:glutathione S-transferase
LKKINSKIASGKGVSPMEITMKLYGHPDSGHAFKVKFFLDWVGVDHEYECIDIFSDRSTRSADFLGISKFSEVPTLIDNGQSYIQSNAILAYLSKRFGLLNETNNKKCFEWLIWEANKIGMCLPQLRAHEKFSNKHPQFRLSQGAYDWLYGRYKNDVNVLDRELMDKPYILGEQISIADFSLCAYLMYANEAQVKVPTNVESWLGRIREQKGWQNPYEMLRG